MNLGVGNSFAQKGIENNKKIFGITNDIVGARWHMELLHLFLGDKG